jgi:ribonucleoside-triphosphate reductase (thioredoxin)
MEIVLTAPQPTRFRLSEDFLAPYRKKGDPFASLLARSTYLTKYCRGNVETWTDTIRRVVEGNICLAPGVHRDEAELLFHLFWTGQALPPGRGLWTGGVEGIPADARFNCWYTTLNAPEEWCWTADRLMLGGGVGVGLCEIDSLPIVSGTPAKFAIWCRGDHPDLSEVRPEGPAYLNGTTPTYRAEDSREGWVESLRRVLAAAYTGRDLVVDVSDVRQRGTPIRTFGGIACGPGPLAHLLRAAWTTIRGAQGRRLSSVEALDITNHIGLCIKSGNVRRSALIALGSSSDQAFRDAKKDVNAVVSHRHTSNNSLCFQSWEEIESFDWHSLVEDNIEFGEPGILNLPLAWKTDPGARGVNPCGEQTLHDREACNLAEVFPAKFEDGLDASLVFRLVTRYAIRQRLTPLIDPISHDVGMQNMRVGVGLGGLCDFPWTATQLSGWFMDCRKEADSYADDLGVNRPITVTTVKPSGTISLLNGSSPGIHAPHSPFYIRRTRIAKNDPMAQAMIEACVPYEEDVYDKSGHTWVFAFPMMAPHSRVSKETETLRGQFERQSEVQHWWADNAVSATLNFDPKTEREELAQCLKEFVPQLKSTSCLPKSHGYAQAPYEAIEETAYHALYRQIRHDHPLVSGGDMDTLQGLDECQGGVCPVR